MQSKYFFRYMLIICLLAAAGLGCKLVENIRSGVQLASTGVSVATEIGGMVGMVTQMIPPGMGETAQAGMPTFQAMITEGLPTMQAFATQVYTSPEQAPPDIPVMEGERSAFVGSPQAVSYVINTDFDRVVEFYKKEMPANGWTSDNSGSGPNIPVPGVSNAELSFTKDGRKAVVVITAIPFVGQTTVVITLEG